MAMIKNQRFQRLMYGVLALVHYACGLLLIFFIFSKEYPFYFIIIVVMMAGFCLSAAWSIFTPNALFFHVLNQQKPDVDVAITGKVAGDS
jgi:hypothetical protein